MNAHNIHACCVAIGENGVLIRGQPGSGKSDLLLRLLDESSLVQLVADDQVYLKEESGFLYASAPKILAGKLEIRGQGIVARPHLAMIKLSHVIDLVDPADINRLPHAEELLTILQDHTFPCLKLDGRLASAPARIRAFLRG